MIRHEKRCHVCKETKSVYEFYRDASSPDGHVYQCKSCRKTYRQSTAAKQKETYREYWKRNQDAINEEHRRWYRENIEAQRARGREKERRFRTNRIEYHRRWRAENGDKCRAYEKAYARRHPERLHALRAARRAAKLSPGSNFSSSEWALLCETYRRTCLMCGRQEPDVQLTADHVVPLIHGGGNGIDNIQPLCRSCNSSKNSRTADYRDRPPQAPAWTQLGLFR